MIRSRGASAIFGLLSSGRHVDSFPINAVPFELPGGSDSGEHTDELEQLFYEHEEDDQ